MEYVIDDNVCEDLMVSFINREFDLKCRIPDIQLTIKSGVSVPKLVSLANSMGLKIHYEDGRQVEESEFKVIISLTSWKGRLYRSCSDVVESLLHQNMRVKYKVVLVLSRDELGNCKLPDKLVHLKKYNNNFEILWVDRDIRSHKKLMPVIKKYPNHPIIISDDDCIRDNNWAAPLYNAYLKDPKYIYTWGCGYLSEVTTDSLKFEFDSPIKGPSILNRASNGNVGTIYPPHIFDESKDFFNEDLYMKLSPSSDETWQWCHQALLGIKTIPLSTESKNRRELGRIKEVQDVALYRTNKEGYDVIYRNILSYYPQLREILLKELSSI